jgi:hypothetical protein
MRWQNLPTKERKNCVRGRKAMGKMERVGDENNKEKCHKNAKRKAEKGDLRVHDYDIECGKENEMSQWKFLFLKTF